jgi:hypothetical protein
MREAEPRVFDRLFQRHRILPHLHGKIQAAGEGQAQHNLQKAGNRSMLAASSGKRPGGRAACGVTCI